MAHSPCAIASLAELSHPSTCSGWTNFARQVLIVSSIAYRHASCQGQKIYTTSQSGSGHFESLDESRKRTRLVWMDSDNHRSNAERSEEASEGYLWFLANPYISYWVWWRDEEPWWKMVRTALALSILNRRLFYLRENFLLPPAPTFSADRH